MRIKKDDLGRYAAIHFLDHCIIAKNEPDDLILAEAVGRIAKVTSERVVLDQWTTITACAATRKNNAERTVILQSAIKKVIYLNPEPQE